MKEQKFKLCKLLVFKKFSLSLIHHALQPSQSQQQEIRNWFIKTIKMHFVNPQFYRNFSYFTSDIVINKKYKRFVLQLNSSL